LFREGTTLVEINRSMDTGKQLATYGRDPSRIGFEHHWNTEEKYGNMVDCAGGCPDELFGQVSVVNGWSSGVKATCL